MQLMKRYLDNLDVPAPGVTCTQPRPFPAGARAAAADRSELRRLIRRERRAGVLRMPVPALLGH